MCKNYEVLGEHVKGGFADYIAVPAENLYPVPDGYPLERAAAAPMAGGTAWRALAGHGVRLRRAVVDATYPLAEYERAFRQTDDRELKGKVVLKLDDWRPLDAGGRGFSRPSRPTASDRRRTGTPRGTAVRSRRTPTAPGRRGRRRRTGRTG